MVMRSARTSPISRRGRWALSNDLLLETLDKRNHVALFGLRHPELRQRRRRVTEEYIPVALADTHSPMAERHVPAAVVHRSASARAQEVNQSCFSRLTPSAPRCSQKRPSCGSAWESGQRSFATAAIAS